MTGIRLSTNQIHQAGISNLMTKQLDLATIQQQLTTGKRISQGKDDPAAMASAQRIDQALASLDQYGRNSDAVKQRLELQDTTLGDAADVLRRAHELAIQANNSGMSDEDRQTISIELRSLRANLLGIANREDGNGRRLFAGTQDGVTPFTDSLGSVTYSGTDGQNGVTIGLDQAILDANPGSQIFMRVPTGDGRVASSAAQSNTGTGLLYSANVTDYGQWGGGTLQLRFTSATDYEVVDGSGSPLTPPVTGAGWTAGQKITAQGAEFVINGAPAAGDTFTIAPAQSKDVFATLEELADALDAPSTGPASGATRINSIQSAIADLATAQDHMNGIRADTGARLSAIDVAADTRSADILSLKTTRSSLTDTNYTEVISNLAQAQLAYQAAQATVLEMRGLSLFERM